MARIIGLVFLVLTGLALWRDWSDGALASLGQRWAEMHRTSLIGLQSGLENRVNADVFFDYVLPVLELPAAAVLAAAAALILLPSLALRRLRAA